MSALVLVLKSDSIDLLTDIAGYESASPSARITKVASKQIIVDAPFRAAVAVIGWEGPLEAFERKMRAYSSFAELSRNLGSLWRETIGSFGGPLAISACDLFVAGFDGDTPRAFMVGDTTEAEEFPAFKRCRVLDVIAIGALDSSERFMDAFAGRPDAFDAHRDGLAVMEAMRREAFLPIGYGVQHTCVRRGEVTSKIIHRWPDQVGRPVNLEAA